MKVITHFRPKIRVYFPRKKKLQRLDYHRREKNKSILEMRTAFITAYNCQNNNHYCNKKIKIKYARTVWCDFNLASVATQFICWKCFRCRKWIEHPFQYCNHTQIQSSLMIWHYCHLQNLLYAVCSTIITLSLSLQKKNDENENFQKKNASCSSANDAIIVTIYQVDSRTSITQLFETIAQTEATK